VSTNKSDGQDQETSGPYEGEGTSSEDAAFTAQQNEPPFTVTIKETARLLSVGRTTALGIIGSGAIKSFHIGSRHLVVRASIAEYVDKMVAGEDAI